MPASKDEDHPRRIGQYEVLGAIGKGAMGQVYKAVQPSLNRIVAVKVLPHKFLEDATRVERFNREAKAVALLSHPNIVQIIDKDQDDDTLFFVMEYVAGSSLDDVLQQRRLSLQEAFTVFRGICHGLEAAHRQNVIHRDLNPRNVLVSDDFSVVKLADFGISKVESISREMGTLSTAEASMGTLHYMSPEQATNAAAVDHRTDIYSAGVLLYEMLTGRVPVGRFNLPSQINSEVPSEIDPIVLKCLATDAKDRYPTVGHLIKAVGLLEDQLRLGLVNELKGISRSTSRIFRSSTQTFARNRKVLLAAAAALVVIGGIVGATMLLKPTTAAPPDESTVADATATPDPNAAENALRVQTAPRFDPDRLSDSLFGTEGIEAPEGVDDEPPADKAPATQVAARAPAPKPAPAETTQPEQPAPQPTPTAPTQTRANGDGEFKVAFDKLRAGLYDPAIADFEDFLKRFPESTLKPAAYLAIAEAHARAKRVEQALAGYVEVQSRFPSTKEAAEAAYRQGEFVMLSDRADKEAEALGIFDRAAVQHPNSSWAPLALMARASLELARRLEVNDPVVGGRVPAALVTYRTVTELYGRTPQAEKAFERLAQLYDGEKRYDLAAATYEQLGGNFPNTSVDAWWEAGQLYDKKLDNNARAVAAYQRVPESSRNYKDAQKRIARLSR